MPGSIDLDLGRHITKILVVVVYGTFPLVEPGVTFNMPDHLEKHNLRDRVWIQSVIPVPVNYGIRFSGPVTALTARRVRYSVAPDLICQPGPSPGMPFSAE